MGRVVRGPRLRAVYRPSATVGEGEAHVGPAPGAQQQPGDNYLDRTAKYVPAEVLGFFLFVNNILEQATKASGDKPAVMAGCLSVSLIAWIALLLGALLTPIYVWYVHEEGDAWKLHATVSFIAFPIWAYAIGAVAFITYRDGNLASIMLATFTVISGLVRPRQEIGHRPSDGGRRLPEEPPGPRVIATPGPGTTKTGDSGDRPNDNQVEGKRQ